VCHSETELEDPKDLRARFRKFLILTNERKKMSKTTLRKRISLVAVTALTAGVLSVVAAPVANANIAAGTPTSQATFTDGNLNVAVIPSTSGAAVSSAVAANSNLSLGLIYKDASSTTAQSATMLATGALALYTLNAATTVGIVASGGTFSSAAGSITASVPAIAANLRGVLTASTATNVAVVWTPGAVGTYTISAYKGNGVTFPSATLGLTRGTLVSQITVTVVASGVAGVYSASTSLCNLATAAGAASATNTDASGANARNNGATGFINFTLNDAYGTALAAGLPLVANVTGNAILDIASTAAGAISASDVDATVTSGTVSVVQSVANAPTTATVTLSYNGATVCTKTITFAGEVASIKAVAVRTQTTGTAIAQEPLNGLGGGTIRVEAFDASGAKVNPLTAGGGAAAHTQFGLVATTANAIVTGVTFYSGAVATGTASTDATGLWPLAFTQASHTCATQGSNAGLQVTFQNPSGSIITSPAFTARCASAAVSYTASWDKASYVQGDIAKLTVQFKDIKGNNAPSTGAAGGVAVGTVTGTTATITAPMMTLVGTLTNNTTVDGNGAIVYTYTVGTTGTFTDGSYNSIVDFPFLSGTTGSVQTATYKVATSGTPGVTNAEVLRSIVALIASINKQIQALQKLILKR
jgi:hypothetical protein